MSYPDPLTDTSRWTILGARHDHSLLDEWLDELFQQWLATLPPDDPLVILYHLLPKPPRRGQTP